MNDINISRVDTASTVLRMRDFFENRGIRWIYGWAVHYRAHSFKHRDLGFPLMDTAARFLMTDMLRH